MQADIQPFHDADTGTFSYVVACARTRRAAIIDPVLDYDPRNARIGTANAHAIAMHVEARGFVVDWILETHAHADHLSAAGLLKDRLGGSIGIGQGVREVQATFRDILDLGPGFAADGSQFDRLFRDGEAFALGELAVQVLATPGHTSDSITYLVGDAAFIGDTLFAPDYGTARCDFPGGDARRLYESVQKLFALPAGTRLFQCHDYPPRDRAPRAAATVHEQRAGNVMLSAATPLDSFVAARRARDATLGAPVLIIPAIQVNIRAGRLPPPAANGRSYLKVPVNVL